MTPADRQWCADRDALVAMVRERQSTGDLLTVREAARRLRRSQDDTAELAVDGEVNVNTGVGIPGGGYSRLAKGDWSLEMLD